MFLGKHPYIAAIISGILLTLATRIPELGWLSFVFLIPTLIALRGKRTFQWASAGACMSFTTALGCFYWIYHVSHNFGGLAPQWAATATILFALINILPGMVGLGLFRWIDQRSQWHAASLFTLIFIASWHWMPALFAWDLALTLLPYQAFIHSIDLVGAIGLDTVIIFSNFALYGVIRERRFTANAIVAIALLLVTATYSQWRYHALDNDIAAAPTTRTSIVQPNIDSRAKSNASHVHEALRQLSALSRTTAAETRPQLIVWPEALFAIDIQRDPALRAHMQALANTWNTAILFGNDHFEAQNDDSWVPYNTASLVTPQSPNLQHYYKHKLLAFGEYIPGRELFPEITDKLPKSIGNFGRGVGPQAFTLRNHTFAPIICYESIHREYMRQIAKLDVSFVAEITNDGWYGRTAALTYHKDLTRLRAIENRIGIIRGTNTGVSTFIDALGREHGTLPIETVAVTNYEMPLIRPWSSYTLIGHWVKRFIGWAALTLLGMAFMQNYRYRRGSIHITYGNQ